MHKIMCGLFSHVMIFFCHCFCNQSSRPFDPEMKDTHRDSRAPEGKQSGSGTCPRVLVSFHLHTRDTISHPELIISPSGPLFERKGEKRHTQRVKLGFTFNFARRERKATFVPV